LRRVDRGGIIVSMATQPAGSLKFRVLGPLAVSRDGQPRALGGERQRALMALLLIHANELVATEQLIDLLFGDQPSTGAVKALQVAISRLRRDLRSQDPSAVIQTRPGGYLLHTGVGGRTEQELALRPAMGSWRSRCA
jgi:DNA-binding SARP family transcriptional activator